MLNYLRRSGGGWIGGCFVGGLEAWLAGCTDGGGKRRESGRYGLIDLCFRSNGALERDRLGGRIKSGQSEILGAAR